MLNPMNQEQHQNITPQTEVIRHQEHISYLVYVFSYISYMNIIYI